VPDPAVDAGLVGLRSISRAKRAAGCVPRFEGRSDGGGGEGRQRDLGRAAHRVWTGAHETLGGQRASSGQVAPCWIKSPTGPGLPDRLQFRIGRLAAQRLRQQLHLSQLLSSAKARAACSAGAAGSHGRRYRARTSASRKALPAERASTGPAPATGATLIRPHAPDIAPVHHPGGQGQTLRPAAAADQAQIVRGEVRLRSPPAAAPRK
jgi:hypothetical protein